MEELRTCNSQIQLTRKLIANGRIKEAIEVVTGLAEFTKNSSIKNQVLLISSQFVLSDKDKKLGLTNDNTNFNKSILNLLESLVEIEDEIHKLCQLNSPDESSVNSTDVTLKDYRNLRILYEMNEIFLQYFGGINKQLKRILLSDALDKETIQNFTADLAERLDELVKLKILVRDLEKNYRRRNNLTYRYNSIYDNKYLFNDADELTRFIKEEMSLLEIDYASSEVKKVTSKFQNKLRKLNEENLPFYIMMFFIIVFVALIAYAGTKAN